MPSESEKTADNYSSEKMLKLKMARERFLGRKAEFLEKRKHKLCRAEARRLSEH